MAHVGFRNLMYIVEYIRDLRTYHQALGLKIILSFNLGY